jgi:tRNA A-37 threonylcarbamoyl transferase component Bud32
MHDTMLGLFNLGGGEIIILLFMLLIFGAGLLGFVLLLVWILNRRGNAPGPVPPVQPPAPTAPPPRACPKCGAPLPASAPEGLCPRCVLGVGLATHTEATGDAGPYGTKILQPPPAPGDIARLFPQLEILECLGRGGMGVVYKARQPKLNRLVALKVLAPEKGADPKFAERFLREAQALARLSHPNIVTVHDFGEAEGHYYLLMEYVDGVTLRQLLQSHKITPEEALDIVPSICDALQFAHQQGIVHRDIKPENVLLDKQGRVKIADFGIAKLVGAEAPPLGLTEERSVIGTPHYMAPEQVEKPQLVDHRADIYSLGVVFYEMLTGELPLGKFAPPSSKVQVDVRLDEVVLHALEKEPERRYQQASDVKSDVETIAAGRNAPAGAGKPAAGPVRILRWRDLWPWDTTYIIAFLIVPMVGAALLVSILLPQYASEVFWLLGCASLGLYIVAGQAAVGYRLRRLRAALHRPGGEIVECLIYLKPLKTPGLAVLHADRLELIPLSGPPMTVALAHIVAVAEVRWFVAQILWWKQGFVLELANGRRVGVAVAEPTARRWRARLSRGSLPEIKDDAGSAARAPQTGAADRNSPRLSRTALWGALWASWLFAAAVAVYLSYSVRVQEGRPHLISVWLIVLRLPLLLLNVTAPFGTTILGWIAVAQIRHSAGRLYGLGLALFDGLLYPLLLLGLFITWVGLGFRLGAGEGIIIAVVVDGLVAWWIVRRVTRSVAARRPAGGGRKYGYNTP